MPVITVESIEAMSGGLKITGTSFYEEEDKDEESEFLDSPVTDTEPSEDDIVLTDENPISEEEAATILDSMSKRVVDYVPFRNISRFFYEDNGSVTLEFQNGLIQYYKGITGEMFIKMLNAFDRYSANAAIKD